MCSSAVSVSSSIAAIASPGCSGGGPPSTSRSASGVPVRMAGPSAPRSKWSTTRSTTQWPSRRISSGGMPSASDDRSGGGGSGTAARFYRRGEKTGTDPVCQRSVVVEHLAEARARLAQHPLRGLHLVGRAGVQHLARRAEHLVDEVVQRDGVVAHVLPGLLPGLRLRQRGGGLAAGVRQLVGAAAALRPLLVDEVLVLQLLQRRVNGSRAGTPHPAAALGELAD